MSWQDYVDKQLLASRCVTKAAIAGHDGNVWAKSEGFEVSSTFERIIPRNGRERKRESEREREKECVCVSGKEKERMSENAVETGQIDLVARPLD